MESMKKIREAAPQIEKLKKKYKNDQVGFAKAQADFYREKKINPGAGCLPYLLQIVVLISLFTVFSRTLSQGGDIAANFNPLLYDGLKFAEGEKINVHFLYFNLTQPDIIRIKGLSFPLPGLLLILSAALQVVSAKVMTPLAKAESAVAKRTKGTTDDTQVAMQKSMSYIFPLTTLFVGMQFSSALALYWAVFSLVQLYQTVKMQGWGDMEPTIHRFSRLFSVRRNRE